MAPWFEGLVDTAVGAGDQVVGIPRIKGQSMVIRMLVLGAELTKGDATVVGHLGPNVHLVKPIELVGRGVELLVVVPASATTGYSSNASSSSRRRPRTDTDL